MVNPIEKLLMREIDNLDAAGLLRKEHVVAHPQKVEIILPGNRNALNFCSNDFLGFSFDKDVHSAAMEALKDYGYGSASGRLITGTQKIHKQLEEKITEFLGTEDTMLLNSGYAANLGIFDALTNEQDMIFCDALSNPSIIDGIRLATAQKQRYRSNDLADLETQLKMSKTARFRVIATDGVFPADGTLTRIEGILNLAKEYSALVVVDDSLGVGLVGKTGRGSFELLELEEKSDIISGSFGYALGSTNGGFISGKKTVVDWLRQSSRPYALSEAFSPAIAAVVIKILEKISMEPEHLVRLRDNAEYFREALRSIGCQLIRAEHPIVSVMLEDAVVTQKIADQLLSQGILASGLCYPNVPKEAARIRFNVTASHTKDDLDKTTKILQRVIASHGLLK